MHPLWPEPLAFLPPHLLFEGTAYFVGYRLFVRGGQTRDPELPAELRLRLAVAAVLGGALGSKLSVLLDDPFSLYPMRGLSDAMGPGGLLGGKSIVGGLLGGLAATEILKWSLAETRSTGDRWVRPLWVGMAIGRIGCFLSGVTDGTHGSETTSPLGMDLGDGISRHPTALYEIVALIVLGSLAERCPIRLPGDRFKIFLASYLVFRLFIEELKPVPTPWLGWSGIQLLCALGLLYYAVLAAARWRSR